MILIVIWIGLLIWLHMRGPINHYHIEWTRWLVRLFSGRDWIEKGGLSFCPLGIFYSDYKIKIPDSHRRHEEFHWNHQIKWLVLPWYLVYWYLYWKHGYETHPWEILAREAEKEA